MAIALSTFSLLTISLLFITLVSLSSSLNLQVTGICKDELVSFSDCLPYTAAPPNNSSSSASTDCCHKFSNIIVAGNGFCLCYLVEEPKMLGFPLNTSRILSLSSLCLQRTATSQRILSLQSICLAFEASPPLQSPGPSLQNHSNSSDLATGPATSPTTMGSTLKPAGISPPPPPELYPGGSSQASSATKISSSYHWFLPKNFPPRPIYLQLHSTD